MVDAVTVVMLMVVMPFTGVMLLACVLLMLAGGIVGAVAGLGRADGAEGHRCGDAGESQYSRDSLHRFLHSWCAIRIGETPSPFQGDIGLKTSGAGCG